MIVRELNEEVFNPIELSITIESIEEFVTLLSALNSKGSIISDNCYLDFNVESTINPRSTSNLWKYLDGRVESLGFKR